MFVVVGGRGVWRGGDSFRCKNRINTNGQMAVGGVYGVGKVRKKRPALGWMRRSEVIVAQMFGFHKAIR
jgi:hypothetical protein